jgi:hypothetical protein
VIRNAVAIADDAAKQVFAADVGGPLLGAVRHFRHVLSAMPEESLGPVSAGDVDRLQALGDAVIDHIERQLPRAHTFQARTLAAAVYQIRSLLEETGRCRIHYSAVRHL